MKKSNTPVELPQIAIPQPTPSWLQNFSPLLQQARWFSNNDQDKEALALALTEYKRQPSLDALEQTFDSYLVLEQFEPAKALLKEMKKLGATDAFLNLQKATYYLAQEKFTQANKCLTYAQTHKKELDNRHRAYLYFTQGVASFHHKPQTFPFTQALHYDYLLMPSERSVCYLMRGLIRLEKESYEAAYQDAQSSLHAHPKSDVAHYLRAVAGYYAGHLTHVKQDAKIVLKSKDELVNKSMKNTMQKLQKLLPKEPVFIDKDFMDNLRHQFFDEVDDMINSTDDLEECFAIWTGTRFENKMENSIQKSLAYLREALSKLNTLDLPQKLPEIKEDLQLCVDKHFSQACVDLKPPVGSDITRAQLRIWRKQVLTILGYYNKIYDILVNKVAELADLYHIPVFVGEKKGNK
ncbi:hypothetical protein [Candidatus Avelusimicrobium fimicolum]|uniref:hypothetical protein n=1 Tax=Candidatus Avelusimicrobium fimicolum TaxID=3416216 RepID=UPI003D1279E4